jgi:hypothetical protein
MSLITHLAAAAGLVAVLAAPALAQNTSTALNGQLNWGDVVANITVVSRDDARSAAAIATAAGNGVSGANITGGLDAESKQQMTGKTTASARLKGGDIRDDVAMATAQSNTLQAQTVGGPLNLKTAQFAYGDADAYTRVDIGNARTLSAASSAANNNAATAADHGDLNVDLFQQSTNSTRAYTDVDACCTGATAAAASATVNAWSSSSTTSTVNAKFQQEAWGAASEATADVHHYRAYDVTAATTAAANSATMANEWGYAQLRGSQTAATNVKADTRVTLSNWTGTATASAYGVGNATLATNVGSDMVINLEQMNTGGVSSNAQFTGGTGDHGDVVVASTAIGNAVTGYVCSQCGDAALTGNVNQSNGGNIVSTGSISTNSAGMVVGSSSAIGNSATFIATQKGN